MLQLTCKKQIACSFHNSGSMLATILHFLGMAGVPLRLAIGSTPRCVGIDEAWQGMQNAKESPQNTRVWTANSELSFIQASMLHNYTSNILRSEQLDQTLKMVVDSSEWTNAISKQGERAIRVAILGCSVSAGCGAEDSNPTECRASNTLGAVNWPLGLTASQACVSTCKYGLGEL
jgi:hypothetical protein